MLLVDHLVTFQLSTQFYLAVASSKLYVGIKLVNRHSAPSAPSAPSGALTLTMNHLHDPYDGSPKFTIYRKPTVSH